MSFKKKTFKSQLNYDDAIVRDHQVHGILILPGVTFLDMIWRIAQKCGFDVKNISLQKILFTKPISLKKMQNYEIQISLEKNSEFWTVSVDSRQINSDRSRVDSWIQNATAQLHLLSPLETSLLNFDEARDSTSTALALEDIYGMARASNIVHQDFMKPHGQAFLNDQYLIAKMTLSESAREYTNDFFLHPALLDCSTVVAAAPLGIKGKDAEKAAFIPMYIEEFRATGPLPETCLLKASMPTVNANQDIYNQDINLYNEKGIQLAKISRLSGKRIRHESLIMPLAAISETESNEIDETQELLDLLCGLFSGVLNCPANKVAVDVGFYDQGLESSDLMELVQTLEKMLKCDLYPTLLFEYPTISELAEYLISINAHSLVTKSVSFPPKVDRITQNAPEVKQTISEDAIAIIGLSGAYPMADNIDQFWENLKAGKDCISEIPNSRWDFQQYFHPERGKIGKSYSKWGGWIDLHDCFDPHFFRISPKEAERLDPQERLFLQSVWTTIENAGYAANMLAKSIQSVGVFVGVMWNDYQLLSGQNEGNGSVNAVTSAWHASIANRISYFFDFKGPSLALDAMCSSSLLAVHLACESIRNGDCKWAIAGGVNLSIHPNKYLQLSEMQMLSSDGRCRAFGEGGDGYVPGEGVGSILLKPAKDAIRDRDAVQAIIIGSAVNHGGATSGYTVPSPGAQADVIFNALQKADVDARTISYIEAHGTGTSLGDPIEMAGLTQAFRNYTEDKGFCALGSVKSNVGHLESAAGIVGLTKLVLQMEHRQLVPSLHSATVNPEIDFSNSPFKIQHEVSDWCRPWQDMDGQRKEGPLRGGISSFGAGGTNVHLILQEAPVSSRPVSENRERVIAVTENNKDTEKKPKHRLIVLSAKTDDRLGARVEGLVGYLKEKGNSQFDNTQSTSSPNCRDTLDFESLAYTLQIGRDPMKFRIACLAEDERDLVGQLEIYLNDINVPSTVFIGKRETKKKISSIDIENALNEENIKEIARLWVQGANIEWSRLYSIETPSRIPLPTYPFLKERYWVPTEPHQISSGHLPMMNGRLHPLIDSNISTLHKQCFIKFLDCENQWVRDHVVQNHYVLPAAVSLEMLRSAGEISTGGMRVVGLKNIMWMRPVIIPADGITLSISVKEVDECRFGVRISDNQDQNTNDYSQGIVGCQSSQDLQGHIEHLDIDNIQSRCNEVITHNEFYSQFKEVGISYGTNYRAVKQLHYNKFEALSEISIKNDSSDGYSEYGLNPTILDAAFQSVVGLLKRDNAFFLPFSLAEVKIFQPLTTKCFAYVKQHSHGHNDSPESYTFNLDIADSSGKILVSLVDFKLRQVDVQETKSTESGTIKSLKSATTCYYVPTWSKKPLIAKTSTSIESSQESCLLLFDRDDKRFQALRRMRAQSNGKTQSQYLIIPGESFICDDEITYRIRPDNSDDYSHLLNSVNLGNSAIEILYYWNESSQLSTTTISDDLTFSLYSVFYLTQALLAQKKRQQIRLIYACHVDSQTPSPVNAALAGFLRTANLENTRCHFSMLMVPSSFTDEHSIALAVSELTQKDPYAIEILYEGSERLSRSIKRLSRELLQQPMNLPIRENGVYLITGGTGGLGLIIASHLAESFQAKLILTGRSALNNSKRSKINELKTLGSEVVYEQVDVTNHDEMARVVTSTISKFGCLNGVIHSAGVIRDALITKKGPDDIDAVLQAKVHGTLTLDAVTAGVDLDFFMLFSSLSSIIGNLGQCDYAAANRFLDAFADCRRQRQEESKRMGMTVSINWPLWKESGMTIPIESQKLIRQKTGMELLDSATGLDAFEQCLKLANAKLINSQVLVMYGIEAQMSKILAADVHKDQPVESKAPVAASVMASVVTTILPKIQIRIVEEMSTLLKMREEDLDIEEDISEFGLDSVTLTNLVNNVNSFYNIEINPAVFFEYSTIESFSQYLLEEYGEQFKSFYGISTESAANDLSDKNYQTSDSITEEFTSLTVPDKLAEVPSGEPLVDDRKQWDSEISSLKTAESRLSFTDTNMGSQYKQSDAKEPIAIIGMHGVFPQSENLEVFWNNLKEGKDLITEIPEDRWNWQHFYGDPATESNKTTAKWGGFMKDVKFFDAGFFGITPREANLMDPQQRLFLETVWKTIEDAGYKASDLSGTMTSLFVGVATIDYSELVQKNRIEVSAQTSTGLSHAILANRISYFLNLNGPSEPIDTACSSSLVAVHRAIESIHSGDCEMAIAGGVNTILTPSLHISFSKAGMLSEDGRCKTFDKRANGYVRGEGVGAILLKPLRKAVADGDNIYAVIKASAVNHSGRTNSLTAPSPNAQAQLLVRAYEKADVNPASLTYIEAHGTGTSLGDPIEINGLKRAFAELSDNDESMPLRKGYCGISSVKTNIGHLETAAGIAGIIKVILSLKHKTLPATVNFESVNPYIELEDSPFYIVRKTKPWDRLRSSSGVLVPRRAGVSSFGFGGSNAHVVLEEYVEEGSGVRCQVSEIGKRKRSPELGNRIHQSDQSDPSDQTYLIVLSAKTEERLRENAKKLLKHVSRHLTPDTSSHTSSLADLAYTLQVGREAMNERLAFTTSNYTEFNDKLIRFLDRQLDSPDLYTGNKKQAQKGAIRQLVDGEEGQTFIQSLISTRNYSKLAQLWVAGADINWGSLYTGCTMRRLSLPTYAFAREYHWIDDSRGAPDVQLDKNVSIDTSDSDIQNNGESFDNFFYRTKWKRHTLPLEIGDHAKNTKPTQREKVDIIVVYTKQSEQLTNALIARYPTMSIIRIEIGATRSVQHSQGYWEIDTNDPKGVDACFKQIGISATRKIDLRIYFFTGIQTRSFKDDDWSAFEQSQNQGVISLFRLTKTLINNNLANTSIKLNIVTNYVYQVLDEDIRNPYAASSHGLGRAIAVEYPQWELTCMDVDFDVDSSASKIESIIDAIVAEPGNSRGEDTAIRDRKRYVRSVERIYLPAVNTVPYKVNGVYIIIGGAGGIGLQLSLFLAQKFHARLVLIGRSRLSKDQKKRISEIESAGGRVLYLHSDITDPASAEAALSQAKNKFGSINGVFHAAVELRDNPLANLDEDSFRLGLASKMKGGAVVNHIFSRESLDFMVFFSSAISFTAMPGISSYIAANIFEDAYALYANSKSTYPIKVVNWGYWANVGVGKTDGLDSEYETRGFLPITPVEGLEALQRILENRLNQVIAVKLASKVLVASGVDTTSRIELYPQNIPSFLEQLLPGLGSSHEETKQLLQYQGALDALDRFSQYSLFHALLKLGIFKESGDCYVIADLQHDLKIISRYDQLFLTLLDCLEKADFLLIQDGQVEVNAHVQRYDAKELEKRKHELLKKYPPVSAHIELLCICLENLVEILQGKALATDIMFPNSSLKLVERVYGNNAVADYYNRQVTRCVRSFSDTWLPVMPNGSKIKILEVGAGTGGTTVAVLEGIKDIGDHIHYYYTDVSGGLVNYGEKTYGRQYPFVDFKTLDIERDSLEQEFQPGDFDIVIASNVLHATKNMNQTIANVKRLLKTNGWLVINEFTVRQDLLTLTFGLLDGWWMFEDKDYRLRGAPLLSTDMWEVVLQEQGFDRSHVIKASHLEEKLSQHVIVAESNGIVNLKVKCPELGKEENSHSKKSESAVLIKNTDGDIANSLRQFVSDISEIPLSDIDNYENWSEMGIDSIFGMQLIQGIEEKFGLRIYPNELIEHDNLEKLTAYIAAEIPSERLGESTSESLQKTNPIIYILSTPRAGSTLLRVMMAGHSQIFAPPELHLVPFKNLKERSEVLTGPQQFLREGLVETVANLENLSPQEALARISELESQELSIKGIYEYLQEKAGGRFIVDKSPSYAADKAVLARAEEISNNAFYIHLVRHPSAVVESFIRNRFDKLLGIKTDPRLYAEQLWVNYNNNLIEFLAEVPQNRRLSIRYEDLVKYPEKTMTDLCSRLNIEFEDAMLQPYSGDRMTDGLHVNSITIGDPNFKTHEIIDASLANSWTEAAGKVGKLNDATVQLARELGYSFETSNDNRLSPAQTTFMKQFGDEPLCHLIQSFDLHLSDTIDIKRFESSLKKTIHKHDIFRQQFSRKNGHWISRELEDVDIAVDYEDLQNLDSSALKKRIQLITRRLNKRISIHSATLLTCAVCSVDVNRYHVIFVIHHLVADGVTMTCLYNDLFDFYNHPEKQVTVVDRRYQLYVDDLSKVCDDSTTMTTHYRFWNDKIKKKKTRCPTDFNKGLNDMASKREYSESYKLEELCLNGDFNSKKDMFTCLSVGLYRYLAEWTEDKEPIVNHRLHRRNLNLDKDYSDASGWFAGDVPLPLSIKSDFSGAEQIKRFRHMYNEIPMGGVTFEMMALDGRLPFTHEISPIRFNYQPASVMSKVDIDVETTLLQAPGHDRLYLIDLIVRNKKNSLLIIARYSKNYHKLGTIKKFLNGWIDEFKTVISGS